MQVIRKVPGGPFPHRHRGCRSLGSELSGGPGTVQPGSRDSPTTAATHTARALLEEVSRGRLRTPAGWGWKRWLAGDLRFIINVVRDFQMKVVEFVTGDFVQADRRGSSRPGRLWGFHPLQRRWSS